MAAVVVRRRVRAQSVVEFVLLLPAMLVGLMIVLALGLVARADAGVAAVAVEAARAGSLASDATAVVPAAEARALAVAEGYGLEPRRLEPRVDPSDFRRGGEVRVVVDYTLVLGVLPMLGWGTVPLHHEAAEPIDLNRTLR